MVEDITPEEPVVIMHHNDTEDRRPFYLSYEAFEQLLEKALADESTHFRKEQTHWHTPFGRVERVDALSIKPTSLPNRILVLPIIQDTPELDKAYYLNIYQNTKGKAITYVTEYQLAGGKTMSDFDIFSFTGRIRQYSMERAILQELSFVNGKISTSNHARTCGYDWDPYSYEICSGPVTGEEFCHETYDYDLIPLACDASPHDPVEIDDNPWQGGGGGAFVPIFYMPIDVLDYTNTNWNGDLVNIPNEIYLSNNHVVTVNFGITNDGKNANQPVSKRLVDGLIFSLELCAKATGIDNIYISATTNGEHGSQSNHFRALAMDISRINGNYIINLGANDQVTALQQSLEQFPHIRENFGPHLKNKLNAPFNVGGHADHIHFSVNGN
jgi:hypothetical protein